MWQEISKKIKEIKGERMYNMICGLVKEIGWRDGMLYLQCPNDCYGYMAHLYIMEAGYPDIAIKWLYTEHGPRPDYALSWRDRLPRDQREEIGRERQQKEIAERSAEQYIRDMRELEKERRNESLIVQNYFCHPFTYTNLAQHFSKQKKLLNFWHIIFMF